ncbi:hypothetical protein ATKI12_4419 [Kitasatospora sp. Ki12]
MASVTPLTAHTAQNLAADYDLSSAEVRHLQVERVGSSPARTGCHPFLPRRRRHLARDRDAGRTAA